MNRTLMSVVAVLFFGIATAHSGMIESNAVRQTGIGVLGGFMNADTSSSHAISLGLASNQRFEISGGIGRVDIDGFGDDLHLYTGAARLKIGDQTDSRPFALFIIGELRIIPTSVKDGGEPGEELRWRYMRAGLMANRHSRLSEWLRVYPFLSVGYSYASGDKSFLGTIETTDAESSAVVSTGATIVGWTARNKIALFATPRVTYENEGLSYSMVFGVAANIGSGR